MSAIPSSAAGPHAFPALSSRATIVFDLDGTLAETAPDIFAVLNLILQREGLQAVPAARARDLVGAGARVLIERGFALYGRTLDAAKLDALFALFLELYADRIADESTLFPGVVGALDTLARRGHRLAVCTNKPERHARLLLEALGVDGRFGAISGRDTFAHFKPDPRHLTLTIEAAGGDPADAIMVGDSRTDVLTARAAKLPVICVPFGYTDVPVEELSPDIIIPHFDDLADAVARLIGA